MILLQDLFTDAFLTRIREKTFLIDENGDFVLDTNSEKVCLDNLLFYLSTKNEFVTTVTTKLSAKEVYPFIFIPSGSNVRYSNRTKIWTDVEIKEIFLCNLASFDLSARNRDIYSFQRTLFPLMDSLSSCLEYNQNVSFISNSKFDFEQYHSYKTEASSFEDKLDVLILKNIKLKIKNC